VQRTDAKTTAAEPWHASAVGGPFKPVKLDNARNSRYPFGLPSFDQG
jgi:hypothetical protein